MSLKSGKQAKTRPRILHCNINNDAVQYITMNTKKFSRTTIVDLKLSAHYIKSCRFKELLYQNLLKYFDISCGSFFVKYARARPVSDSEMDMN